MFEGSGPKLARILEPLGKEREREVKNQIQGHELS